MGQRLRSSPKITPPTASSIVQRTDMATNARVCACTVARRHTFNTEAIMPPTKRMGRTLPNTATHDALPPSTGMQNTFLRRQYSPGCQSCGGSSSRVGTRGWMGQHASEWACGPCEGGGVLHAATSHAGDVSRSAQTPKISAILPTVLPDEVCLSTCTCRLLEN